MKNLAIEGGVEGVGASQGWQGISILYNTVTGPNGTWPNMTTHWQLTKEEIAMLVLGGKLELSILGAPGSWPPMMMGVTGATVGEPNDDADFLNDLARRLPEDWPEPARLREIATKL